VHEDESTGVPGDEIANDATENDEIPTETEAVSETP
jgi:hypothetical protein